MPASATSHAWTGDHWFSLPSCTGRRWGHWHQGICVTGCLGSLGWTLGRSPGWQHLWEASGGVGNSLPHLSMRRTLLCGPSRNILWMGVACWAAAGGQQWLPLTRGSIVIRKGGGMREPMTYSGSAANLEFLNQFMIENLILGNTTLMLLYPIQYQLHQIDHHLKLQSSIDLSWFFFQKNCIVFMVATFTVRGSGYKGYTRW